MSSASAEPAKPSTPKTGPTTSGAGVPLSAGVSLSKSDVDSWLDGILPTALEGAEVPGAQVSVVANGRILTQRGFGYADVARRVPMDPTRVAAPVNSVTKLFTGTAVMRLVEQGRLDLDQDVNRYLDYRLPAGDKPITMRNLITHTAGFADTLKGNTVRPGARKPSLGEYLRGYAPRRIYQPGEMVSYSNYGVAVAGYVVERVSGMRFEEYFRRYIFQPLGMSRTSCLPPSSSDREIARPYSVGGEPALEAEVFVDGPAGTCRSTAADMAAFMAAHLNDGRVGGGGSLVKPATARLMHAPAYRPAPGMPANALSFLGRDRNGWRVIGHGGDGIGTHNELALFLDHQVGIYVAFNGDGRDGGVNRVREALLRHFADRYFPDRNNPDRAPTLVTARAHAEQVAGTYRPSRRITGVFSAMSLLMETTVTANPDGTISAPDMMTGQARRYREVAPYRWQDVDRGDQIGARVVGGRVTAIVLDPTMSWLPIPAWQSTAVIGPLLVGAVGVLVAALVGWPVAALVRRRYGGRLEVAGRALLARRLTFAGSAVQVALVLVMAWLLQLTTTAPAVLGGGFDPVLRAIQALGALAVLSVGVAVWSAWLRWRTESWWTRAAMASVALAGMVLAVAGVATGVFDPELIY